MSIVILQLPEVKSEKKPDRPNARIAIMIFSSAASGQQTHSRSPAL